MAELITKYQQYAEYKDSGVEWLGEIPKSWRILTFKWLANEGKAFASGPFGSSIGSQYYRDEGVPVIRGNNLNLDAKKPKFIDSGYVYLDEKKADELSNAEVISGDLVFTARGTVGQIGLVPDHSQILWKRAILSANQLRFRNFNNSTDSNYLWYLFSSWFVRTQIYLNSDSVAQPNLNLGSLKNLKLIIPEYFEQTQIANFLDHETSQIDTLIEKQQTLIQLLKEKRQAVISHAVTKGLNPDAPMKDSGVEWLGEVPEHWEVGRLKNVLRIRNGRDYKEVEVESGGYPVYGSGGIFKRSSDYLFDGESVLFGRKGTVDKPLLVSGKFWTVDTMFYSEVFSNAKPNYIYHQALLFPFDQLSTNTALPSMTQENLLELGFVIPPFDEQEQICQYLSDKLKVFSNLVSKAEQAIQLMQERRTALISAAVTGKIDVRGWWAAE